MTENTVNETERMVVTRVFRGQTDGNEERQVSGGDRPLPLKDGLA
jgi:hypothetical protein